MIELTALDGKTYTFEPLAVPPVTIPDILDSLPEAPF